jgi:hypothetical protein
MWVVWIFDQHFSLVEFPMLWAFSSKGKPLLDTIITNERVCIMLPSWIQATPLQP